MIYVAASPHMLSQPPTFVFPSISIHSAALSLLYWAYKALGKIFFSSDSL